MNNPQPKKQFHVRFADDTVVGPLDKDAVRALARTKRLKPDDLIRRDGTTNWIAVATIPGLLDTENGLDPSGPIPLAVADKPVTAPRAPKAQAKRSSESASLRTPKSNDSAPHRIFWVAGCLAAAVLVGTLIWFVVYQRASDQRLQASSALRAALDQFDALPETTENAELVRQLEEVFRLADANSSRLDADLLARSEALRNRLVTAKVKQVTTSLELASEKAQRASAAATVQDIRALARESDTALKEAQRVLDTLPPASETDLRSQLTDLSRAVERVRSKADSIETTAREKDAKAAAAKLAPKGKVRVSATYFFNDFKGNVPEEAAVFAIPKVDGLQGRKIPGSALGMLEFKTKDTAAQFMESIGGGFGWAGGDGKVELRLAPGDYELVVLMDVHPYLSSDLHERALSQWFDREFARSHGVLGRYAHRTVTVIANDITEASLNLK